MPEAERIQTVEELKLTRKEISNALEKLPIANVSMALQKKKRDMEDQLARLEKAIETFSKKTVYIAL